MSDKLQFVVQLTWNSTIENQRHFLFLKLSKFKLERQTKVYRTFSASSRITLRVSSMSCFVVRKFVMQTRNANFPLIVAFEIYARPLFCTRLMIFSFNA